MRVSTESNDQGIINYEMGMTIFFNGKEKTHCITADEELGYVKCVALPVTAIDDKIATEELYGDVRIERAKK